jgi:hypothetical protein
MARRLQSPGHSFCIQSNTGRLLQRFFKNERSLYLAIPTPKIKAMCIFANDLRTNANHRYGLAPSPLFNLKAQPSPDTESSRAIANDQATDDHPRRRLKMVFYGSIDPPNHLTIEKCRNRNAVHRACSTLDAPAKIIGRSRITKLTAEFSSLFCIVDSESANREL